MSRQQTATGRATIDQSRDKEVMAVFEMTRDGIVELIAAMGVHYLDEHPGATVSEFALRLIQAINDIGFCDTKEETTDEPQ